MAITNLERKIRFSNLTNEEYSSIIHECTHKMLPILLENNDFKKSLSSKSSNVMTKKQMMDEATKLSTSSDSTIANLGKAILQFLKGTVKTIDAVLLAISGVLLIGGVVLATCITLIIGIVLYAVTVLPISILIKALTAQYVSVGGKLEASNDKNVKKYLELSKNIREHENGVKDIQEVSNLLNVSEAVQDIVECDCACANENEEVHALCSIIRACDERIQATGSDSIYALPLQVASNLAPMDRCYQVSEESVGESSILESVNFGSDDGTEMFMTLENISNESLLSGTGLYHGIVSIVTEACDKQSTLDFLRCYKNTAKYEFTHPNYSDIPLLPASGTILEYAKSRCVGNTELMESIDTMGEILGSVIDEAYNEVMDEMAQGGAQVTCANPSTTETGFNPDPFNIGNLTPFPVASRKVGYTLCEIDRAETDDEITEAMLNFARVSAIIEANYTVEEMDNGGYIIIESDAGKVARRASDKANQKFAKAATKDKTGGVKAAVKRTLDPMEKFIQQQYDTLKEKDANERRNIILKGGAGPKVMRWIKRSIGLLCGSAVGAVVPAAAIITGITFIGFIASDKYLDGKERAKLLRELEDEIMICNEKIDDSRGDDNKQNKYELMRIRNQLTRTSEKIRLGLKY